ncbi:fructosamine kinase [Actinorhabdospora filicis]|uniref:Fructosamine kinase n=1 Tax=Actinorhabdospora filicis TaxID=1785913 RepID=A0A9W6WBC3_9ACTN|nr:fructosamine kinase family protein [Actinorhabdospora filicis]GLZ80494.1 fructosamine kinase [Actinorhabdospora filicis]
MDLDYLRAHPHRVPMFIEHQRIRCTPVPGGSVGVAQRLTLDDGGDVFAKFVENGPPGILEAEAAGLRWLAEAQAPVPGLIAAAREVLVLEWIQPGAPSPEAAARLGRDLASLHRSGAHTYGAPWPGFIGLAAQDNAPGADWASWFRERRIEPYLKASRDNGALTADQVAAVESVLPRLSDVPVEPIARLHGDLWPGNVHWGADGKAWLIDPAAHGGHRETDLAQLTLFGGLPHLAELMDAYQEEWPLADGWRERTPLHALHLLLVHTTLFGGSWAGGVMEAVRGVG